MTDGFGKRLRALRKKAGLTQEKLAYLIGVHETTIRRWENNGDSPRAEDIYTIAHALGVPEADLLNDTPPVNTGEWLIRINVADKFSQEVIDLNGYIQPVAQITATPDGCSFTIKANWDLLQTPEGLEGLFKRILKEYYPALRGNGVSFGSIKDKN